MNSDQIGSIVRWIASSALAVLITKGWLDNTDAQALAGAIATLAVAAWGVWVHNSANKVKAVTDMNPGVQVTVSPAAANQNQALKDMANDPSKPQVNIGSNRV